MRTLPVRRSGLRQLSARARSGGQIVVLFAGATVLFILLCGVVVDLSYYWVGSLQAQRAADAAALAGAVYLPGDPSTACSTARASAKQNGFTPAAQTGCLPPSGSACTVSGSVGIRPVQDAADGRQLDVTLTTSVGTFFSRVVGIGSFPVTVHSKGVYVLPVPMGSPDAYYGVGDYSINDSSTNNYTSKSGTVTAKTGTNWSGASNAGNTGSPYATSSTNNAAQQWSFSNYSPAIGATLDGVQVIFNAKVSTASTSCKVQVDLSWDGGSTWDDGATITTPNLTTADQPGPAYYTFGSASSLTWLGSNHTWTVGDFTGTQMRVQLKYLKGSSCGTVSVNNLDVVVTSHTTTTTMTTTHGLYDGATLLTSRGAFGAIITKGGDQSNGDAYSPVNSSLTHNAYNPDGYDYLVKLPAGGQVKVFDPGFCAMGSNGAGGSMGTGDHWIGSSGTSYPVSTYYTVWNTNNKPGLPHSSWTEVYTSGNLFEGETGYDPANMGPNGTGGAPGGATSGCNSNGRDSFHNTWWTIPTGSLAAGTYAVQIQTTKTAHVGVAADPSQNQNTNAENMFSLEAVGGADASGNTPQIYGNGKMVVYNNLMGGSPPPVQKFYLAQIDQATGAGKTALIDLWDIGDISGTGTLRILSPDGGSQHYVNFKYTTDSSCRFVSGAMACYSSGTSSPLVSSITTTYNGAQATNGTWIHISIPLPATYGTSLWDNGWWQVEYTVTQGGNDTTTWQVSVSGNPVHLVVP